MRGNTLLPTCGNEHNRNNLPIVTVSFVHNKLSKPATNYNYINFQTSVDLSPYYTQGKIIDCWLTEAEGIFLKHEGTLGIEVSMITWSWLASYLQ